MTHYVVNVFLPSMHGTKVSFMRDILSEAKLYLRQNEVNCITSKSQNPDCRDVR